MPRAYEYGVIIGLTSTRKSPNKTKNVSSEKSLPTRMSGYEMRYVGRMCDTATQTNEQRHGLSMLSQLLNKKDTCRERFDALSDDPGQSDPPADLPIQMVLTWSSNRRIVESKLILRFSHHRLILV